MFNASNHCVGHALLCSQCWWNVLAVALRDASFRHLLDTFLLFTSLIHSFKLFLHSLLLPFSCSLISRFRLLCSRWLTSKVWCKCALLCLLLILVLLFCFFCLVSLIFAHLVKSFVGGALVGRRCNSGWLSCRCYLRCESALFEFSCVLSLLCLVFPCRCGLSLHSMPIKIAGLLSTLTLILLIIRLLLGLVLFSQLFSSILCRKLIRLRA